MKKHVLLIFLISSIHLSGQSKLVFTENYNGWLMYTGSHKFSNKWGLHLEAQLRRNEVILNPQQLLLRTGVNYHINDLAFATVGYCYVNTYPYGGLPANSVFPENRIWEQLQLKSQYGIFENVNRFRLEQRFVNSPVFLNSQYQPGEPVYSNRFRFLTRFSVPFKGKEIVDRSLYLSAYNEFFISFGNTVGLNLFDQNRAFFAIGYKIPKIGRIEIGYLNQLIFKSNGINVENNHTLQLGISSNINFFSQK